MPGTVEEVEEVEVMVEVEVLVVLEVVVVHSQGPHTGGAPI